MNELPDARDGLTRLQRIVLVELDRLRRDTGKSSVPTVMLYGRVCEHLPITEQELIATLRSLGV